MVSNRQFYARGFRFALKADASPTHFGLLQALLRQGWKRTLFTWRADFSEKNLQFDLIAAQHLEFKHWLAQLISDYCPSIMPVTYCINDENFREIILRIRQDYYTVEEKFLDQRPDLVWILKPALQNNGQNIKILPRLSDISQHFLNPRRLGGEHVLQRYLLHPHLLRGHKYSIRMFVIITNDAGTYLYPHGYFNVAKQAYHSESFSDLNPHLTNEHLRVEESNVIQIPTKRSEFFTPLYQQIKSIVSTISQALQLNQPQAFGLQTPRVLGFFGYDFMVDNDMRVWLLEVNHGPCFPIDPNHVLQDHLYEDFWDDVVSEIIMPIAKNCKPVLQTKFIFDRM